MTVNAGDWRGLLTSLRSQLAGNSRLRIGLWIVATVLALQCIWLIQDGRKALRDDIQRSTQQLSRVEQLLREKDWTQRRDTVRQQLVESEAQIWNAPSRGVAQATLQAWLDEQARGAGLDEVKVRVEIARPEDRAADLLTVGAEMDGRFNANALIQFLSVLSRHPQRVIVERLDVIDGQRSPRFAMTVRVWFRTGAGESQ